MKKIFSDPSVIPCDALKSVLEAQGLMAFIKNERGSASIGAGWPVPSMINVPFAWPEVWVSNDDYELAKSLMADMQKKENVADSPWICPHCQEEVNGELNVCWNCEKPKNSKPIK